MSLNYPGSLHNHTQYSNLRLRDCIIKEEDLIDYAIALGHKAVAITDHESISSWVKVEKYYSKVKKKHPDFKVLRGNEIYLCRNGLNSDNFNKDVDKYYHFILIAKDLIGAKQIMEVSTRAWNRSYMARGMRRVPTYYQDIIDIIGSNPGHVIASTACLGGALPTQILRGTSHEKLAVWIKKMDSIFGHGNFYFEMQPSRDAEQTTVNKTLLQFSKIYDIGYIITTDSHYLKKEDRAIHKAYLNAQNGDREVDAFYATTYLMDTEELESFFPYLSKYEIELAYQSINKIIDSCEDFSLIKPLKIPQLPWVVTDEVINHQEWSDRIPMLETFWRSDYEGDNRLADEIVAGIYRHPECDCVEAYDEINECLKMTQISSDVNKAHWSAYFLNLQKIVKECWNSGTLVGCGRGSGVGFILLYLLDITQINPLKETTQTFRWRLTRIESKAS